MMTRNSFLLCLIVASLCFCCDASDESCALLGPIDGFDMVLSALRAPQTLYEGAVAAGAYKANAPFDKIFKLGIVAGAHVAFAASVASQ